MPSFVTLYEDQTDPDISFAWYDADGDLRDFTGWALTVELVDRSSNEIALDKVTGVVGGDGTGSSNVLMSFSAAELAQLVGPSLAMRIVAVNGSETAVFTLNGRGTLPLLHVLPAPAVAAP
jgi:hypothetical protein